MKKINCLTKLESGDFYNTAPGGQAESFEKGKPQVRTNLLSKSAKPHRFANLQRISNGQQKLKLR